MAMMTVVSECVTLHVCPERDMSDWGKLLKHLEQANNGCAIAHVCVSVRLSVSEMIGRILRTVLIYVH